VTQKRTRAVDTLRIMEKRGSITTSMLAAGEAFRQRFMMAQLDPLRAVDWARMASGGYRGQDCINLGAEKARRFVWRALQAVGGVASPAGSVLWHCVGWEISLKEWALGQGWNGRRVSQESASGILIAALGTLEAHLRKLD
jgi:hypothetical protein